MYSNGLFQVYIHIHKICKGIGPTGPKHKFLLGGMDVYQIYVQTLCLAETEGAAGVDIHRLNLYIFLRGVIR